MPTYVHDEHVVSGEEEDNCFEDWLSCLVLLPLLLLETIVAGSRGPFVSIDLASLEVEEEEENSADAGKEDPSCRSLNGCESWMFSIESVEL